MTEPEGKPNFVQTRLDHQTTVDDVNYLRSLLGVAFVEWVLADSGNSFKEAQLEMAGLLASMLRLLTSQRPELPVAFALSGLDRYVESSGTTLFNYCRNYAGGEKGTVTYSGDDGLLSAFMAFAAECYGEMLLSSAYLGQYGPYFRNHIRTEAGRNLVNAVYASGTFPARPEVDYGDASESAIEFMRAFPAGSYAERLLQVAWNHAKLEAGIPTLDQFAAKIPLVLEQHRSLASGKITAITAVASLTGARLPEDMKISGTWGRIRPARTEDHPSTVRDFVNKRTSTDDNGDRVEISDAGDIIFETDIPMQMRANEEGWSFNPQEDFGEKINKVRLAFALAVERPSRPIIFAVWNAVLVPLAFLEPFPLADPQFMAQRMPTLLTREEIASWQHWLDVIMSADISALRIAMTRTLRAMAERRDPGDRLIDAVIAWESLFGGKIDSTLRVTASLTRFLHSTLDERELNRKEYGKIYEARSDIVHGNKVTKRTATPAQLEDYGRSAIGASLSAIAKLLTTHTNLLQLESSERSTLILLGADNPFDPTRSMPEEKDS